MDKLETKSGTEAKLEKEKLGQKNICNKKFEKEKLLEKEQLLHKELEQERREERLSRCFVLL